MQEFELIAKTFQGLEEVLAQELIELGANNVAIGRCMVSFTGDKAMMYRANFCLRTAIRILMPVKHFKAKDADEVYAAYAALTGASISTQIRLSQWIQWCFQPNSATRNSWRTR